MEFQCKLVLKDPQEGYYSPLDLLDEFSLDVSAKDAKTVREFLSNLLDLKHPGGPSSKPSERQPRSIDHEALALIVRHEITDAVGEYLTAGMIQALSENLTEAIEREFKYLFKNEFKNEFTSDIQ